jgi:hypothetical protein
MIRKLLICPWFGDLPPWWDHYAPQIEALDRIGYDFIFPKNAVAVELKIRRMLDVNVTLEQGGSKMHDIRPLLGLLYADVIALHGFSWWGHTDFDCVYGRLDQFVTDDKLDQCDIYSDCAYDYLAGPFTLYRVGVTEDLFRQVPGWRNELESPETTGWVEKSFTDAAYRHLRVKVEYNHAYLDSHKLLREGDSLYHDGSEISYFHFNRTKEWPL